MKFSAFAPMSLYRLSAREPDSKAVYRSLMDGYGDQFDKTVGGRIEALCFMNALAIARARKRIQQARDQRLPSRVVDLIERREAELGIVPGPNDSLAARRAVLVERSKLPSGGCRLAVETALQAALGADFIEYRVIPTASATVDPPNCGDWPMTLPRQDVPRKIVQLLAPVAFIGTPITVAYQAPPGATPLASIQAGIANTIVAGDVIVFEPGRPGQWDRVTVTDAVPPSDGPGTITATFTRPHESGAWGFTHPFPLWRSTRRDATVVVSAAAAQDPEKRRKVNDEMRRHARSVSTWAICAVDGPNLLRWQLGVSSLGFSTLQSVAL